MAYTQITQLLVPYIHNGQPLIGGSAEFYVTGTTTPYVVYADNQGNGGASTRTFESDGTVLAYSDGTSDIKIIIRDSDGAQLQSYDGLFYDRVGELSGKLDKTGGTMSGDINMGSNDITNGGDITVGDDKHFIADHSGSVASIHPDDALYIATATGNNSLRGGSSLGIFDDGNVALTITESDVVSTGDVTISSLTGNTGEVLTLDASGKILAGGTSLSSINSSISTNAGNISTNTGDISTNAGNIALKVSKAGDTMSGALDMDLNEIQQCAIVETIGLYITNSGGTSTQWFLNDETGTFEISDNLSVRQFSIGTDVSVESKKITNVTTGVDPNDAVNVSQLSNYVATSTKQNTITDDDSKIPSSGAVVDYAVPLSSKQNTITDDDSKVPSSGAVVDYVSGISSGTSLSNVYVDDDISTTATSNVFTVSATGVGDSTKGARVTLDISTEWSNNFVINTIELTRPVGSSTFYYTNLCFSGHNVSLGPQQSIRNTGSNNFASSTAFAAIGGYTSTDYSYDVKALVTTNAIQFDVVAVGGTPASWSQQLCTSKVEIFS